MKYLRRFNESNLDIISEIEDRTMDLQDEGFSVNVYKNNAGYVVQISHKDYFTISDVISDHLEHLVDFMKSNGYDLKYGNMFHTNQNGCGQEVFFYLGSSCDDEIKEGHNTNRYEDKDVVDDVKDICLELEDIGFTVNSSYQMSNKTRCLYISKRDDVFKYTDIEAVIDRLKAYLGDKIESIESQSNSVPLWVDSHYLNIDTNLRSFRIVYKINYTY